MIFIVTALLLGAGRLRAADIVSAGSGPFTNPATWVGGVVPGGGDKAIINSGHTLTLLAGEVAALLRLEVRAGGVLRTQTAAVNVLDTIVVNGSFEALSASTIQVASGFGGTVLNNGFLRIGFGSTLNLGDMNFCNHLFISTGQLVVNPNAVVRIYGRFRAESGQLIQDGGDIIFYGNSGVAATSVAATEHIAFMNAEGMQCTAGSMTLADPHHATMFTLVNDVQIAGHNPQAFSGTHIFYAGDGSSTRDAHPTRGLMVGNGITNGSQAPLNHVVVRTGNAANRVFTGPIENVLGGLFVKGNLTVAGHSHFHHKWNQTAVAVGGNLTVEAGSIFTCSQLLIVGAGSGYTVSSPQVVGGSGVFRNEVAAPQFLFQALEFNNSGSSPIRFEMNAVTVADSVSFRAGLVQIPQMLEVGNGSYSAIGSGKINYVSGGLLRFPNTVLRRWLKPALTPVVAPGSGYDIYPWCAGDGSSRMLRIAAEQVTVADFIQSSFVESTGSVPIPEALQGMDNGVFVNRMSRAVWQVQCGSLLGLANISLQVTGGNILLEEATTHNLRLYREGFLPAGVHTSSGTVAQPVVTRTGIANALVLNGNYRLAGNNHNLMTHIPSVQSGSFTDSSTWQFQRRPDVFYGARVMPGHTVTLTNNQSSYAGLVVEATGTLHLHNPQGQGPVFTDRSTVKGTLHLNSGNVMMYLGAYADTSLHIAATGSMYINHSNAHVLVLRSNSRAALAVNSGTLQLQAGRLTVFGSLRHDGASGFYEAPEAVLELLPNTGISSTSTTLPVLDFSTTGTVQALGTIQFSDPPLHAGQLTIHINRNNPAGFSVRQARFVFGYASPFGSGYPGHASTGFMLETKGGTENMPLGRLVIDYAHTAPHRFVRNGAHGFFAGDSVLISNHQRLWITTSTNENIFGGTIVASSPGALLSQGRVILGGTPANPGYDFIKVEGNTDDCFINDPANSTAHFNELEVNHTGMHARLARTTVVAQRLLLTRGLLFASASVTLGTGTAQTGQLMAGSGRIYNGYFYRWLNTNTIATGDAEGWFPLSDGRFDRSVYAGGTAQTGGIVGFAHTPAAGRFVFAGFTDGGITVDAATASVWEGAAIGYVNSNMQLRFSGGGLVVTQPLQTRLVSHGNTSLAPSLHLASAGTATHPVVERTAVHSGSLINGFRIATPANQLLAGVTSIQSGPWDAAGTWDCNCVPLPTQAATVSAGHTVRVSNAAVPKGCGALTIAGRLEVEADTLLVAGSYFYVAPGGELRVSGGVVNCQTGTAANWLADGVVEVLAGKLHMGLQSATNAQPIVSSRLSFTNTGRFVMSGGELFLNGRLAMATDATAQMTGGRLLLVSHLPNNAFYNYTGADPLLQIIGSTQAARTKQFSGGDIFILNPQAANLPSVVVNAPNPALVSLEGSTLHLGFTGWPAERHMPPGHNASGFRISSNIAWGHVSAEGGNYDVQRRHVSFTGPITLKGNLTISPGCEWVNDGTLYVSGNLINNGIYTSNVTNIVLGGNGFLASQPQTLGGSGRFRFATGMMTPAGYEPWLDGLKVDNYSSAGVRLERPFKMNRLELASGDVTVTDSLQLGIVNGITPLLVAGGTGAIIGKFTRWIVNTGPLGYDFPVGVAGIRRNIHLHFTTAPTQGGTVSMQFVPQPAGINGLPVYEGGLEVKWASGTGFWRAQAHNGLNDGVYNVAAQPKNFNGITDFTKLVLLKRSQAAAPWLLQGTHVSTTGSNSSPLMQRMGLSGFSDFGVGSSIDFSNEVLPVVLLQLQAAWSNNNARLSWQTTTEQNSLYFEVERSQNLSNGFVPVARVAAAGYSSRPLYYQYTDAVAGQLPGHVFFYRLKLVDRDGSFSYSGIVALRRQAAGISLSAWPNPSAGNVQVAVSSPAVTGNYTVQVLGANGQVVHTAALNGGNGLLQLGHLPDGLYVLVVARNGQHLQSLPLTLHR